MMNSFAYESPTSVAAAVSELGTDSRVLAGGTDILALMKDGVIAPKVLVNIKDIADLGGIKVTDGSIKIGATVTLNELAGHSAVQKHLPALADAAVVIGGPQIRNMGTMGGNLCQRNRDWYFRNNLDPEEKEETQYSAIFPMDGQIYVHPSTLAPPLIVYGATAEITGPDGKRSVPVEKLFQVASGDKMEVVLAPNEIVTAVLVPVSKGLESADYEVRERDSHDWPLIQAAVGVKQKDGKVTEARIVLGHVAPVPHRVKAAEQMLVGKELTEESAAAAGKAALEGAKPLGKNEYKVTLGQVAVKRALLAAVGNEYWRADA